jgi:integral membrane protein (TIGR00529 family)
MIVMAKILCTLILVVWLLRKRVQIGHAMLAGSIILFLIATPTLNKATTALRATLLEINTWEIMLAMFFVMCLEHLLRTSGTIEGFMTSMKTILRSDRILLALMPAFLGLLPSLGGAIFSAPMVEHASKKYPLTPEDKITINYWFRHIWEYGNPIVPAMILASQITSIPLGSFVTHMIGYTLIALVLGWIFILTGKKFRSIREPERESVQIVQTSVTMQEIPKTSSFSLRYVFLALGPIIVNIILVVSLHLSAAISMGLVVLVMVTILRLKRKQILKMLTDSFDKKLLWGILSIMLFQHVLNSSGLVQDLVVLLQGTNLPIAIMIGLSALMVGILTGATQGFVAVIFPIVAVLAPGNIQTATTAYLMGVTGCMLSPAHLCLIVTGEYFKGDIFKSLRPILLLEGIIIAIVLLTQFA